MLEETFAAGSKEDFDLLEDEDFSREILAKRISIIGGAD